MALGKRCATCGRIERFYDAAGDCHLCSASKAVTMADLTGSEKQIAWAQEIRRYAIGRLMVEANRAYEDEGDLKAALSSEATILGGVTSAKWWLDHRTVEPLELVAKTGVK